MRQKLQTNFSYLKVWEVVQRDQEWKVGESRIWIQRRDENYLLYILSYWISSI